MSKEKIKGTQISSQVTLLPPRTLKCFGELTREERQRQEGGEKWGGGDGRKRERREVGEEGARKRRGRKVEGWRGKRNQRGARGRKPFLPVSSTAF